MGHADRTKLAQAMSDELGKSISRTSPGSRLRVFVTAFIRFELIVKTPPQVGQAR